MTAIRYLIPLIIALILFLVMAAIGLIMGGNSPLSFGFWFFIVPVIAITIPSIISKNTYSIILLASIGSLLFYTFVIFITYKHYQTDYFKVMMASMIWNSALMIFLVIWNRIFKLFPKLRN